MKNIIDSKFLTTLKTFTHYNIIYWVDLTIKNVKEMRNIEIKLCLFINIMSMISTINAIVQHIKLRLYNLEYPLKYKKFSVITEMINMKSS